ncbi:uncharacterized protein LOC114828433 [Galendromus occidentalis]|uniref:Uncharacterized protein LOC114828433 n=1 Tax=Galendromus occidentalis TaxID=34638 RepID=A0AAJ7SIK4_9ACAR|nr:uncharacterized protein LOC114828433 [Galendromus occidentalis]
MTDFMPPFNRKRNKFSEFEKNMLKQIHADQQRDLSNHVVDEKKLHDLCKEEEYIFELQTEILNLYEDIGARQAKVDKRVKKLRTKNSIGRFVGDYIENLQDWDGESKVEETADADIKALQDSALAIVNENWSTKLAIDAAVEELYQMELKIMHKKVDMVWENLKDLPVKKKLSSKWFLNKTLWATPQQSNPMRVTPVSAWKAGESQHLDV